MKLKKNTMKKGKIWKLNMVFNQAGKKNDSINLL